MVATEVKQTFVKGQFYTLKQVKGMLQTIYSRAGYAVVAKASDLEGWIVCRTAKKNVTGRRENGYEIM